MTLAELSTAWNDLRNATLGQSVVPLVKPVTATTIGNYYERWRAWYATAGAMADMVPDATAAQWLSLYRDAAKLAKADGAKFTELEAQPLERAVAAVTTAGKGLIYAAAAVAVPLLLLVILRGQRR
jgi:hypothetical protein